MIGLNKKNARERERERERGREGEREREEEIILDKMNMRIATSNKMREKTGAEGCRNEPQPRGFPQNEEPQLGGCLAFSHLCWALFLVPSSRPL